MMERRDTRDDLKPSRDDGKPIRIVVVEDSPIQREALVDLFEEDHHLKVVAAVGTGREAIARIVELKPDLVTCDIGLPDIDGFEVVKTVMVEQPTPIIMLTATLRPKWRKDAFHALTLGAMDVIEKPELADLNDREWRKRLQRQLRFIAHSPVVPHVLDRAKNRSRGDKTQPKIATPMPASLTPSPVSPTRMTHGANTSAIEVLAVVASAGGPKAVRTLLEGLLPSFPLPVPVIVALHLGRHMGASFAGFLGQILNVPVVELFDGATFEPGTVYVAPGRKHVEVLGKGKVRIFETLPGTSYCPSLDYFLWSVARVYGKSAAGVILTGMGSDGADGLLAMRRAGALTAGQDEGSSLVYGMPRVAQEIGAVSLQQSPSELPNTILDWLGVQKKARA